MTKAVIGKTKIGRLPVIRVNGRRILVNRIETLTADPSGGKWTGLANGKPFEIIGGKKAGGASNEWFVKWEGAFDFINVRSFHEAVRCIEFC
jgi:hypothetical protein